MIEEGKIRFRTFILEIKKRPIPNSYLLIFSGGTDIDSSGWETPSGDRKKLEGDFKFMWNPLDAPSNKKGEYVVRFSEEARLKKFQSWLDNQIKQYGGVLDK
jgi:predicted acetyltransferase